MKVTGENVILFEYVSEEWRPYACARSVSINFVTELLETSVSGSGSWATYLPTKNSWTASMEGVVHLEESGKLSIGDLRTKQFNQTRIQIKFERTDEAGNIYAESGYAFITNSSDTGSFNDMDTFAVDMQGTGAIAQIFDSNVIAGFYRLSTINVILMCALAPTVLYSSVAFGTGTIMYEDSGLTIPLTGKNYIVSRDGGEIFNIDNVTGEVGAGTGDMCT